MTMKSFRVEVDSPPVWVVLCDRDECLRSVFKNSATEEQTREHAMAMGWQLGTSEIRVDLCPNHIVEEKKYTRLFDDDGYPLNKLLPRTDSNGRPLRSKR